MRYPNLVSWCCLAAVSCLVSAASSRAATFVVDNFDSDTVSPAYVQSNVLAVAGNDAVVSFDTTTNADKLTYSFTSSTNNAVQTTFLRDDFALTNDGDYFQLTVTLPAFTGTTTDILGGLVLDSGSKSPGDRSGIYLLQIVGGGSVRAQIGDSTGLPTVNSGSGKWTPGQEVILRITRNSATSVTPTYSVDNGATFVTLTSGGNPVPHPVAGFNAVGMFGGSARTRTLATLTYDNLLYVTPSVPVAGDFDADGDVDGADFVAWQTNFPKETGGTLAQGDADADGDVDGADFVVWQTNFPFPAGAGAAPVPEPSAFVLGIAAVLVGGARVRRCAK